MTYVFRTYVITAGNLTAAKAKLEAKGQEGNSLYPGLVGHFTTPLSASGSLPATRYAASGLFSPEEAAYLDAELPKSVDIDDGTAGSAHDFFAQLGLKMIHPIL